MAEILPFPRREASNLVADHPLELRRGDWNGGYGMLCVRGESLRYEDHRKEALHGRDHQHIRFVPEHFALSDGCHYTLQGLLRHRKDEALMRKVYRLAGLMECITGAPSAILRTDLLRRFYELILQEREALHVFWRGNVHKFLFPLHPDLYNPNLFTYRISLAGSLKELYENIEHETDTQFDILCQSYVIYLPIRFLVPDSDGAE